MSYGVAPSRLATSSTCSLGTKRNVACRSMNRAISHGHAIRSTRAFSRVTHFMARSCSGVMSVASSVARGARERRPASGAAGRARRARQPAAEADEAPAKRVRIPAATGMLLPERGGPRVRPGVLQPVADLLLDQVVRFRRGYSFRLAPAYMP